MIFLRQRFSMLAYWCSFLGLGAETRTVVRQQYLSVHGDLPVAVSVCHAAFTVSRFTPISSGWNRASWSRVGREITKPES